MSRLHRALESADPFRDALPWKAVTPPPVAAEPETPRTPRLRWHVVAGMAIFGLGVLAGRHAWPPATEPLVASVPAAAASLPAPVADPDITLRLDPYLADVPRLKPLD